MLKWFNKLNDIQKILFFGTIAVLLFCLLQKTEILKYFEKFDGEDTYEQSEEGNDSFVNYGENIEDFSNDEKIKTFVLFYAPWCGHCKTVMPDFDKLENDSEIKNLPIIIKKINCDTSPEIAEKHGIQGFPTLKLLNNDINDNTSVVEYEGERNFISFKNFIKNNL